MKRLFALIAAGVVSAAMLGSTVCRADDWPTYGTVTYGRGWHRPPTTTPIYTPGYSFTEVAPNGAIHYYYVPGHPYSPNDQGPAYYYPAFRSSREVPGHVYYYYGSYGNPNAFYDNRR
jgi:hypothetical protein